MRKLQNRLKIVTLAIDQPKLKRNFMRMGIERDEEARFFDIFVQPQIDVAVAYRPAQEEIVALVRRRGLLREAAPEKKLIPGAAVGI